MGPLQGLKVIEMAGVGPTPFCGMLLADLGADVLRIDRKSGSTLNVEVAFDASKDILSRGRRSAAMDLKSPLAIEAILDLSAKADVLIEGFRPGVMERLGLSPDVCLARNSKLVYGRMTGWGQTGPMANRAGHDINYIGLSGALYMIGRRGQKPTLPMNLIGDFGGGGLMLAYGIVCATLHARLSGHGQVVDAAMVEGSSTLMAMQHAFREMGIDIEQRGVNPTDGGAHFNDAYETMDGHYMAVGAAEPKFYHAFLDAIGLDRRRYSDQMNRSKWPQWQEEIAAVFLTKTQTEWCEIFDELDVCVTPVLPPSTAHLHPHNAARNSFVEVAGMRQPAPAPRFSRTPGAIGRPPPYPGECGDEALLEWGFDAARLVKLRTEHVLK